MNENDEDIREAINAFEAALMSGDVPIPTPTFERILLALDQSNQDETVEALAIQLARRHQASIHVTYAYGGESNASRNHYLEERRQAIKAADVVVTASRSDQETPFDQILEICQQAHCDLIIMSSPYLDDLNVLGSESIGTTLDIVLSRRPVPVLVVREPKTNPAACLQRVLLPTVFHTIEDIQAISWGLHLIASNGTIRVLIISDSGVFDSITQILGQDFEGRSLDESMWRSFENKRHASLIAAIQKRAAAAALACRVSYRLGEPVAIMSSLANEQDSVVVTGCPSDHQTTSYQQVLAFIRESANPVLVV